MGYIVPSFVVTQIAYYDLCLHGETFVPFMRAFCDKSHAFFGHLSQNRMPDAMT